MSNKLYTTIPAPKVKRNTFNRSRYNSLTLPYQRVCPVALEEIYPGDAYRWGTELFARCQPMVAPVMTDQRLSLHAFWVPLRTVNEHYQEFMYNNRQGNYSDVLPYVTLGSIYTALTATDAQLSAEQRVEAIRLCDYIGLPFSYQSAASAAAFLTAFVALNSSLANSTLRVNLAPFIAYTKVWSEYFRDENLVDDPFEAWTAAGHKDIMDLTGDQTSYLFTLSMGRKRLFITSFLSLRPRAWQHDRFTSALPFAQRGPDVLLPVTGTVSVTPNGPADDGNLSWDADTEAIQSTALDPSGEDGDVTFDAAISGVSTTINDFRRAERLQRWYENSARGGVRQNEATLAHFGVRTDDATIDRAVFLGGTRQPIVISEIAQTSETTANSPQGTLAGKGSSYKAGGLFRHFFKEHGFVFVFASALIRPAYFQGLPRVFSRMQRDEYYWPEFALLGEEPVYDKELFVGANTTEDGVFGYVPRYSDLKSAVNECHGDFRTSLDFWVNARKFANQPQLNQEFIFGDPQKLMYAVRSNYTDSLLLTIRHDVKASRLMPFYGVPTI